jgi:hypothetical protein
MLRQKMAFNKCLDAARQKRENERPKINQINKLTASSSFDKIEILAFIEIVMPEMTSPEITHYIRTTPDIGDVKSLLSDLLCLKILD